MGPLEEIAAGPAFSVLVTRWLEKEEAARLKILRAHSRRWEDTKAAAIISHTDGALSVIEKLRAHITSTLAAERAAANERLVKGGRVA